MGGVHPIPVNHRVVKSFSKRQFDCGFFAGNAARSFDQPYKPVNKRRDCFRLTRYPSVDFEQAPARMSFGKLRLQARSAVRGLYSTHPDRLTTRGKCTAWANSQEVTEAGKLIDSLWDR
jgi:hypothetical protein